MQTISEWNIYWITRLDYIQGFFVGLSIAASLAAVIMLVIGMFNMGLNEENSERGFRLFKKLTPAAILCILAACLVPDTKEYAAIKIIPAVASSKDVQGLGKELVDLGKEWLTELKPTKGKQQ